jgi:hypothetical protein
MRRDGTDRVVESLALTSNGSIYAGEQGPSAGPALSHRIVEVRRCLLAPTKLQVEQDTWNY